MRLSFALLFLVLVACSSEREQRSFDEASPTEPNANLGDTAEAPDTGEDDQEP